MKCYQREMIRLKNDNMIDIEFTHWKVTQSLSKGRLSLQLEIDGQQKLTP